MQSPDVRLVTEAKLPGLLEDELPAALETPAAAATLSAAIADGIDAAPVVKKDTTVTGAHAPVVKVTQHDAPDSFRYAQYMTDNANNAGRLLKFDHFGSVGSAAYCLDIQNYPGAKAAFVIHQYSGAQAAVIVDNTNSNAALFLRNTQNDSINPGNAGTGPFIRFDGYETDAAIGSGASNVKNLADITGGLIFRSYFSTRPFWFAAIGHSGPSVKVTASSGGPGIDVIQASTSATSAITVTTSGTAAGIAINATGPALQANGSGNAQYVAYFNKTGTGSGSVLYIANKGTGNTISAVDATAEVFAVTAAGLPKWSAAANAQTTVGAAGAASALPATPAKYLKVQDSSGTTYVIPAYAAS